MDCPIKTAKSAASNRIPNVSIIHIKASAELVGEVIYVNIIEEEVSVKIAGEVQYVNISECRKCGGDHICEHGRIRSVCKECRGGSICKHNRQRNVCKDCDPKLYLVSLYRTQIQRCFKPSKLRKKKHSIEYSGCGIGTLDAHLVRKMELYNNNSANKEKMTRYNTCTC